MATTKQSLYDLSKPGDQVILEGTLVFSSLAKKIESNSKFDPEGTMVNTITVADPQLADPKKYSLKTNGGDTDLGKNILRDASEVTHGTYKSKSGQYQGHTMWSFDSKSKLPVTILDEKTHQTLPAPELLEHELASGQKVLIGFSIYHSSKWGRNGGSLDFVGIEDAENIQYANGGGASSFSNMFASGIKGNLKPNPNAAGNTADSGVEPAQPAESNPEPAPEPKTPNVSDKDLDNLFGD